MGGHRRSGEAVSIAKAAPAAGQGRRLVSFDNLLSGFIGAFIGAVLVIGWERWVWRRENRAAARIVDAELMMNKGYLEVARKKDRTAISMLGTAAWDAEQVRVASLLNSEDLMTIVTAYESVRQLLKL